jgi:spermidine synthase
VGLKKHVGKVLVALGADLRLKTADRAVLEETILPYFARHAQFQRILFIGCDWYTKGYAKLFADKEYWTLEPNSNRRKYGAVRHVQDFGQNVTRHFRPGELDVVFLNGVFGYGLNDRQAVEESFEGIRGCLRDGGVFVFGWNDVPQNRPFPPEEITSLKRFSPFVFPPLASASHRVDTHNRHVFSFYTR